MSDDLQGRDADSLIYKFHKNRKLNPFYVIFTKPGMYLFVFSFFLFVYLNGGMIWGMTVMFTFSYLYKNHFPYKVQDVEKVYYVEKYVSFLNKRRDRTVKSRKIIFAN